MAERHRILIVEDNVALAENIAEILEASEHDAEVVTTAEDAIARLEQDEFVGIITDIRLPGMSGVDLIAKLRNQGHSAPVVVMTAFANEDTVAQAEELGALDVLPKPVDLDRLLDAVGEFASEHIKVLVLEDSQDLAENIAAALKESELEPILAATVQGALAQRHLPRVAVVDLRLPDGSGLDAARRLAARDPRIRVLLVTGYGTDLAGGEELSTIEEPIFEKPFDMRELLERIQAGGPKWRSQKP